MEWHLSGFMGHFVVAYVPGFTDRRKCAALRLLGLTFDAVFIGARIRIHFAHAQCPQPRGQSSACPKGQFFAPPTQPTEHRRIRISGWQSNRNHHRSSRCRLPGRMLAYVEIAMWAVPPVVKRELGESGDHGWLPRQRDRSDVNAVSIGIRTNFPRRVVAIALCRFRKPTEPCLCWELTSRSSL